MKFEELKSLLIQDADPVKRLASPYTQLLRLIFVSFVVTGVMISILEPRIDLPTLSLELSYWAELFVLLLFVIFSGFSALKLAVPGNELSRKEKLFPPIALLAWITLNFLTHQETSLIAVSAEPGIICLGIIVIIGSVFAVMMYSMILSAAPLIPTTTGIFATLFCLGVGAIVLHFICPNSARSHLLIWHVLPVICVPVILVKLYRRIFKF